MKSETEQVKTVSGPKAAVATFVRPSDKKVIYVYCRRAEPMEIAIKRVMKRNGASGGEYAKCN